MQLYAPPHRLDEFPVGYSLAGCAPAEPAAASPTGSYYEAKGRRWPAKTSERSTVSKLFVSPQGASPFSPAERRKYAKTRWRAEAWAEDLTDWCARIVAYLRARRHALWDTERLVSAWAREHLNDPSMANDWRWEVVYAHAFDNQRGDALNELIEQIEASSPMELAAMRRPWEAEAA